MRFLFAFMMITASAFAQDNTVAGLAAKLGQQLASRGVRNVAVLRFTNTQNYDPQFSAHLVDQLNRALVSQSQGMEVASRAQCDSLLRELRLVDTADIGTKDLLNIATRLMVDAVITGTFMVGAQTIAVDTTVLDGHTAHIMGGESATLPRADFDPYLVMRKGPPPAPGLSIPAGTQIDVKLAEKIGAGAARNGKTIAGTLESDVVIGNVVLAHKGSDVKVQATSPDGMELRLNLAFVTLADQRSVPASSDPVVRAATMGRSKGSFGGVLSGGSIGVPQSMPQQMKPGEENKNAVVSFHLNQDAR